MAVHVFRSANIFRCEIDFSIGVYCIQELSRVERAAFLAFIFWRMEILPDDVPLLSGT